MEKETKNKKKTTTTSSKKAIVETKKATATKGKSTAKRKSSPKVTAKSEPKSAEKIVVKTKTEKQEVVAKSVAAKDTRKDIKEFFNSEIGSLLKLVVAIAAIILIFLFVTNIINNLKKNNEDLVTSKDIQYDEILVSNVLNQKNSVYYVLVYDAEDLYYNAYNTYLNNYKTKSDAIRVYTSVLSNGFNKKYYSKGESKVVGASISDLKFKGTTLIKVQNGTIVSAYEEPTSIIEHLSSL